VNRRLARLMAAVSESYRRPIGASPAERQRFRRAEDRDMPVVVRKSDCPGCIAARDADPHGRWPVGDCGPECLRRAARRAS
jgi:hypothetical protein